MGLAGGWTLLSALPMERESLGASRGSFAFHWQHDRSVVAPYFGWHPLTEVDGNKRLEEAVVKEEVDEILLFPKRDAMLATDETIAVTEAA